MRNLEKEMESKVAIQRKKYSKPIIEIVPLFPNQTVLGTQCFSSSNNTGRLTLGCDPNIGGCVNLNPLCILLGAASNNGNKLPAYFVWRG
jgi:hypothetical protein